MEVVEASIACELMTKPSNDGVHRRFEAEETRVG